jgi:hypothetical protein
LHVMLVSKNPDPETFTRLPYVVVLDESRLFGPDCGDKPDTTGTG